MPDLEIQQMLVLSTRHIPLPALKRLNNDGAYPGIAYSFPYGWFVYVGQHGKDDPAQMAEWPAWARDIYLFAQAVGVGWIKLDADALTADGLAAYEH